jgi:gas vesicle protein
MPKQKKSNLGGLVVGSVIGAAAGILLAPKSGKETREDIKNKAEEIRDKGQEALDTAKEKVESISNDIAPKLGALNADNLEASFRNKLEEVTED